MMKTSTNSAVATVPAGVTSSSPGRSLAGMLRETTREAHARAEKHPLHASMVAGHVTKGQYVAWIGQMHHVWQAVDAALAARCATDARFASMVKPYHAHADRIAADIEYLSPGRGCDAALPATGRFVEMVRQAAASLGPELIGIWYVLEGSTNGGRFIARSLSRALGIAGPDGLRSMDPHGEEQRERWRTWRADLDALSFTETQCATIAHAARWAFDAIYELLEDLGSGALVAKRSGPGIAPALY